MHIKKCLLYRNLNGNIGLYTHASERQRRRWEYVTIRFPLGAYTFSAHCTAVRELKQRCENEFFPAIDKNTPACAVMRETGVFVMPRFWREAYDLLRLVRITIKAMMKPAIIRPPIRNSHHHLSMKG